MDREALMYGNVLFLPALYVLSQDQVEHHEYLQALFRNTYYRIERQEKGNQYNIVVRKQAMTNLLRSKFKAIYCSGLETRDKCSDHTRDQYNNL